jgi:chromosome segregation ATPase
MGGTAVRAPRRGSADVAAAISSTQARIDELNDEIRVFESAAADLRHDRAAAIAASGSLDQSHDQRTQRAALTEDIHERREAIEVLRAQLADLEVERMAALEVESRAEQRQREEDAIAALTALVQHVHAQRPKLAELLENFSAAAAAAGLGLMWMDTPAGVRGVVPKARKAVQEAIEAESRTLGNAFSQIYR